MPSNETKQVLVPVEDAQGECYHAPGGCGGHLVTTIEATAAELVEDRDLRPCRARGCKSVDIPTPTRCDGCGTPIFEPDQFNEADYCKGCATHLHKFPSKQDHEQYDLRDPQLRVDGGSVKSATARRRPTLNQRNKIDVVTTWNDDDELGDRVVRYDDVRCPECSRMFFCIRWEATGYPEVHCPACGLTDSWPFDETGLEQRYRQGPHPPQKEVEDATE